MDGGQAALNDPLRVAVVGAGRIGTAHATLLRHRVPGARLVGVADAVPDAAAAVAERLGCGSYAAPSEAFADEDVEAVVISASSTAHADLVERAAAAGKAVFCEKPAGMTLAEVDRGLTATGAARVPFQVGFNRRFAREFAEAHRQITAGVVGTPQLMRSLTRDPGLADPGAVPAWTIFTQTLIHDFDTLLWLNPGAAAVTVHATADALVAPEFKDGGLLDTAVVVVTFDNGAIAVAEASFSASYGYDVRGEVFGSAGMVTMGDGAASSLTSYTGDGRRVATVRSDVELLGDAYLAEFVAFADAVREQREPAVTGQDARRALAVAVACIASMREGRTIRLEEVDPR